MQDIATFISLHPLLIAILGALLLLLLLVEILRLNQQKNHVSPAAATQLINRDNAVIIDIRTKAHYSAGHILSAYSFSAEELRKNPKLLDKFKSRPLIIVCATGADSQKLAAALVKSGRPAYSIAGGVRAWLDAQLPLVKE